MTADRPTLEEVREAVYEAYTWEGQRIWWDKWDNADPATQRKMERIICTESGGT
jgi:hypothetical protein